MALSDTKQTYQTVLVTERYKCFHNAFYQENVMLVVTIT